jgi:hypothetical protein
MMMYEVKVKTPAGIRVFKFHGTSAEAGEYAKRQAKALNVIMDKVFVKIAS